jgi:phosphinothricin acetyltransferase
LNTHGKAFDFSLRLARGDDAEALLSIYAPHVAHGFASFELTLPTVAEFRRRIEETLREHPWLVAEREGELAGYAYASVHRTRAGYRWSCDVSVYVAPAQHRRGAARVLYRALFSLLRTQGFVNAYAGIALPNPASVALHEGLGFEPVGVYRRVGYKHGSWRDVGWWALALVDPADEPAVPRPLADLEDGEIERSFDLA